MKSPESVDLLASVNTFSSASSCAASLCTYVNAVTGGAGYTLERRVVLSWLDWLDWGCGRSLEPGAWSLEGHVVGCPYAEGVGSDLEATAHVKHRPLLCIVFRGVDVVPLSLRDGGTVRR